MNFWTTPLLITLIGTSTLVASQMDCKDGKCRAILPPSSTTIEQNQNTPQELSNTYTVQAVEYTIEQDFVPLEIEPLLNEESQQQPNQEIEKPELLLATATISSDTPIQEEHLSIVQEETTPVESATLEEESNSMDEDVLLSMGEDIEYVCEEERSVMCDIDTHLCICA